MLNPFALLAQATTHWMPVGMYPPLQDGSVQACLYAPDTSIIGTISPLSGNQVAPYLPALMAASHSRHFGTPCFVIGALRYLDPAAIVAAGWSAEDHEAMRQAGKVWFFDATGDDSRCFPIDDPAPLELWGGLYASGHVDFSGQLPGSDLFESLRDALVADGHSPQWNENKAGVPSIALYGEGVRATIATQVPMYSLHMDADVGRDFANSRQRFDRLTATVLANLKSKFASRSMHLLNPGDLDFSYTDSTDAYSVMKSQAANAIADPLGVALRDWHRLRGK